MRGRQSAISSKRTILTNDPSFNLSCTHPSSRSVEWLPAKSAPGARSCLGVESTSLTLIQRRDRIVCPVQCNDATSRPASRTGAEPVVFTSATEQLKSGETLPLFRSFVHSTGFSPFYGSLSWSYKICVLHFLSFQRIFEIFFSQTDFIPFRDTYLRLICSVELVSCLAGWLADVLLC